MNASISPSFFPSSTYNFFFCASCIVCDDFDIHTYKNVMTDYIQYKDALLRTTNDYYYNYVP